MANPFDSKNVLAAGRQLKVQKLVIPFKITASGVPANVVVRNDEPSLLFIRTEGVDQITSALASGETASYTVAPVDADGKVNFLVKLMPTEAAAKVMCAEVIDRVNGGSQPCKLGDADGLSSLGNIMLTMDATTNLATTDLDACIRVEYAVVD